MIPQSNIEYTQTILDTLSECDIGMAWFGITRRVIMRHDDSRSQVFYGIECDDLGVDDRRGYTALRNLGVTDGLVCVVQ